MADRVMRDKDGNTATVSETARGWLVRYPNGKTISVGR